MSAAPLLGLAACIAVGLVLTDARYPLFTTLTVTAAFLLGRSLAS